MVAAVRVAIEAGSRRVFASALDWPGWSRGARSESDALAALVAAGPRYRRVVARSPGDFEAVADVGGLRIVERLPGGAATDFGVPAAMAASDDEPLLDAELARWAAILESCWQAFDQAAAAATGVTLQTGPRGGGRDLDRIVAHVLESDEAYLRQLGARPPAATGPVAARVGPLRAAMIATLRDRAGGSPPTTAVKRPWSPRYFVRRAAWHALDHAWEIEDRSAAG